MKKPRFWLILVMVALLATLASGPVLGDEEPEDEEEVTISREGREHRTKVLKEAPDPDEGRPARRGGIIVNFRPGLTSAERERVHRETGVTALKRARLRDSDVVSVKAGDWKKAMKAYRDQPEVQSVDPDLIARTVLAPNDPCFTAVPNPCSTTQNQWGMTKINAPQAWDTTTGSTAVRVAVLDCGVYAPETSTFVGHPDLQNGKVVNSINFTTSPDEDDWCDHGTHVAGIAAANTNNGIGVAGVGFNTKIVNVKVLGDNGSGSFAWIISGILWAAGCPTDPALPCGTRRAEVINMSLGAAASCSSSLQQAINRAWDQGLVIVAAAGNNNTSSVFTPASCNNTVAVSASTTTDAKASFSNFGSWVDVAAPGTSILSTNYVGTYSSFNGTSMSSPHVAGLAALVWTTPHNTGNAAVVDRILTTANHGALAGSVNGRIDAAAAVASAGPDVTPPSVTIN
ncbi:MAG TPA: S8 family serine peptidase, partial [Dehalococcoidia bacterium]|nr:S8 family serine peptidase [Dehalococcoidia bacterium]